MNSTPRAHRTTCLTAAIAASIVLAACGKTPSTGADPAAAVGAAPSATASASVDGGQSSVEKMNGYTDAYNQLIDTFGLPETRDRYFEEDIPNKSVSNNISITDGWLDTALGKFKKARALPGNDLADLDKAADTLIASLDPLVVQLKALDIYYESKAYTEDGLARGKAEDAAVRSKFDASTAAMQAFSDLLDREQETRDARSLAALKTSGDLLGYNTRMALQEGKQLIDLFDSEGAIGDAAIYTRGDAIVAELEKTLAAQREHYAAAKAKEPAPDYGHESVASNLVSLIGAYREMKQSRETEDYNDMIEEYNRAIESANGID